MSSYYLANLKKLRGTEREVCMTPAGTLRELGRLHATRRRMYWATEDAYDNGGGRTVCFGVRRHSILKKGVPVLQYLESPELAQAIAAELNDAVRVGRALERERRNA